MILIFVYLSKFCARQGMLESLKHLILTSFFSVICCSQYMNCQFCRINCNAVAALETFPMNCSLNATLLSCKSESTRPTLPGRTRCSISGQNIMTRTFTCKQTIFHETHYVTKHMANDNAEKYMDGDKKCIINNYSLIIFRHQCWHKLFMMLSTYITYLSCHIWCFSIYSLFSLTKV